MSAELTERTGLAVSSVGEIESQKLANLQVLAETSLR